MPTLQYFHLVIRNTALVTQWSYLWSLSLCLGSKLSESSTTLIACWCVQYKHRAPHRMDTQKVLIWYIVKVSAIHNWQTHLRSFHLKEPKMTQRLIIKPALQPSVWSPMGVLATLRLALWSPQKYDSHSWAMEDLKVEDSACWVPG